MILLLLLLYLNTHLNFIYYGITFQLLVLSICFVVDIYLYIKL